MHVSNRIFDNINLLASKLNISGIIAVCFIRSSRRLIVRRTDLIFLNSKLFVENDLLTKVLKLILFIVELKSVQQQFD